VKDFRDLKVWEKSHQLTLSLYRATRQYPKDEIYGLTSQTRRAAASVPANIAEGCGRGTDADFARFLQMAMGSACELDYHLLLAHDLMILDDANHAALVRMVVEVKRMLVALIAKVTGKRPSSGGLADR
jgi:four helix bundle protein